MKLSIIYSTLFLFLMGCSQSKSTPTLEKSDWQVERIIIGDSIISIDSPEHPTLSFNADSTFDGQTMCNSISGIYHTTQSGAISMSIEAITTAFCPENTIEGIFIEQISMSHHYKLVGDTLYFKDDDGKTVIALSSIERQERMVN